MKMQNRYAFVGGQIVLPEQVLEGTLLVNGEKIEGILLKGAAAPEGYTVVDVSGKIGDTARNVQPPAALQQLWICR